MKRLPWGVCMVAWLCAAACGRDTPPPKGSPAPQWRDEPKPQVPSEPSRGGEPEPSNVCAVVLRAGVEGSGRVRTLRVHAINVSSERVTFEVPERCPNGLIDWEGLGPGYDYYGTCAAGACVGWPDTRRLSLEPGSSQPLAQANVYLDGRPPCTTKLEPGRYPVRPVAPPSTVVFCTEEAILDVSAPAPPGQGPTTSEDPYWCRDSSDCVLSCPEAPGCCGHTCGCQHAINVRHRAAYEASYSASCSRPPCPPVACAYQPAFHAVCVNDRCQGSRYPVVAPGPGPTRGGG